MSIDIRFQGIVDTLVNIATDKFKGRLAWATNIARMIWYYDANNYGEMARRDVLETFAGGIQDSTVTSGEALVAGASGRIQSQTAATFRGTIGLGSLSEIGDYLSCNLKLRVGNGTYALNPNNLSPVVLEVTNPDGEGSVRIINNSSTTGCGIRLTTPSNTTGEWLLQKRDDGLFSLPVGSFSILDLYAIGQAFDSRATPISIHPGSTGQVNINRALWVLGAQRISTAGAATLASVQASNLSGTGSRPLVADASGNVISGVGNSAAITVVQNVTQTPPGSPVTGIPYLVASGATGAWAGQDDKLATWNGSAWSFATRDARSICYNLATVSPVNATFASGAETFSATSFLATGIVYASDGFQSQNLVLPGDHAIIADSTGKIKNLGTATREMIIQPLPITNAAPDVVTVGPSGSMRSFGFDGVTQTEELFYHVDLQHDYIAGTDVIPHVHWMPSTNGTGDVVWKFDYQWVEAGGTFGAPVTATCAAVAAGGTAWADKRSQVTISGTGKTYGSRLLLRMYRDPSDGGDTYGADAVLSSIGVHYSANPIQLG